MLYESPRGRGNSPVRRNAETMNAAWGINLAVVVVVAGSCYTNVFNRLDTSASIQQKMLDALDLKHLSQLRTEMDDTNYRLHASDQQFGQLWHAVSGIKTRVDGMWEHNPNFRSTLSLWLTI